MTEAVSLRINLDAPIMPGEGAAGLRVGHELGDYVDSTGALFRAEQLHNKFVELKDHWVLRSFSVRVWVESGIITQISVRGGYRGSVHGRLRLGDMVGKVASEMGVVGEDDEDNLVCANLPGLCFEIPASLFVDKKLTPYSREWLDQIRDGRIYEFFVFTTTCDCGGDLRDRPDIAHCPSCGRTIFDPLNL